MLQGCLSKTLSHEAEANVKRSVLAACVYVSFFTLQIAAVRLLCHFLVGIHTTQRKFFFRVLMTRALYSFEKLETNYRLTLLEEPEKTPEWLTTGVTYLLPKIGRQQSSQKLPTNHVLNNHVQDTNRNLTRRVSTHLEAQSLLPAEQNDVTLKVKDERSN
jgi:hypothetical protein